MRGTRCRDLLRLQGILIIELKRLCLYKKKYDSNGNGSSKVKICLASSFDFDAHLTHSLIEIECEKNSIRLIGLVYYRI